jgi:hypothetical protein
MPLSALHWCVMSGEGRGTSSKKDVEWAWQLPEIPNMLKTKAERCFFNLYPV